MPHVLDIPHCDPVQVQAWFAQARVHARTPYHDSDRLKQQTVALLFQEPSTRTLASFVQATHQLGGHPFVLPWHNSATCKGESVLDTAENLAAMGMRFLVVRHEQAGMAHAIAQHLGSRMSVINAGDGANHHPTQALLDAFTLTEHLEQPHTAKIVLVGDLKHSRVARSFVQAAHLLGWQPVHVLAPESLQPDDATHWPVHVHTELKEALDGADAVMALRLQKERFQNLDPISSGDFQKKYGITLNHLTTCCPKALLLHPGPVMHGVELSEEVLSNYPHLILTQVRYGVALRAALLAWLATPSPVKHPLPQHEGALWV